MTADVTVLTIDQLPTASNVATSDLIPLLQGGVTKAVNFGILSKSVNLLPMGSYVAGSDLISIVQGDNVARQVTANALGSAIVTGLPLFTPLGAGAIQRPLQSKARDYISLFDFLSDAKKADFLAGGLSFDIAGDISTAISSLPAKGGGILLPPYGSGLFGSQIVFDRPVHLFSMGSGGIITAQDGSVTFVKKSTLNGSGFVLQSYNIVLENFSMNCQVGNGGAGIETKGQKPIIRGVAVYFAGTDGFRIGQVTAGGSTSGAFYMEHCTASNCVRHGIYVFDVDLTRPANLGTIIGCGAVLNGGDGLKVEQTQHTVVVGFDAENNTGAGIHLTTNANNTVINGGDTDEANAQSILIDAGATDNCIFGGAYAQTITDNGVRTMIMIPYNGAAYPGQVKLPVQLIATTQSIGKSAMALVNGANQNVPLPANGWALVNGPTAGFSIGGIVAPTINAQGYRLSIHNSTAQTMTISNNAGGSSAANRIFARNGADLVLAGAEGQVNLIYEASYPGWTVEANN